MSDEVECCDPPHFNITDTQLKVPVKDLVKPKELIIFFIFVVLFVMSMKQFFKHWKKNYYDNSDTLPTYYKDESTPTSPIREYHCLSSRSASQTSPSPQFIHRGRRHTLSPNDYNQLAPPKFSISLSGSGSSSPAQRSKRRMSRAHSVFTPRSKRPPLLSSSRLRYHNRFSRQYSDRQTKKHTYFISNDTYDSGPGSISIEIDSAECSMNGLSGSRYPSSQQILPQKIEEELEVDEDSDSKSRSGKDTSSPPVEGKAEPESADDLFRLELGSADLKLMTPTRRLDALRNRLRLNVQETVLCSVHSSTQDELISPDDSEGLNSIQTQVVVEHCPRRFRLERSDSIAVSPENGEPQHLQQQHRQQQQQQSQNTPLLQRKQQQDTPRRGSL